MVIAVVRCLGLVILLSIVSLASSPAGNQSDLTLTISGERRISLDDNWRFHKGDAPGAQQP
jgi:hypothetical protein